MALNEFKDIFTFPTVQKVYTSYNLLSTWSRFGLPAINYSTPSVVTPAVCCIPSPLALICNNCTKLIAARMHQSTHPYVLSKLPRSGVMSQTAALYSRLCH